MKPTLSIGDCCGERGRCGGWGVRGGWRRGGGGGGGGGGELGGSGGAAGRRGARGGGPGAAGHPAAWAEAAWLDGHQDGTRAGYHIEHARDALGDDGGCQPAG